MVTNARRGDDMYGLLKDLEKKVHTVRTGGWFRPGAHGYNRALRKYKKAEAAAGGPKVTKFGS
jgi:hypothetical protein